MNRYSIFLALCLLGTAISDEIVCPDNCVYKKCADPCPRRCETFFQEPTCNRKKCAPGCECIEGYILRGEECIPLEECVASQCGLNSDYAENPCSTTCANMFTNVPCKPEGVRGCQCLDGYFKNSKGDCVPAMECSVAEVICPPQSSFSTCASSCPKNCRNQFLDLPCDRMCNIRCDCNPGYIYNDRQECVRPETCNPREVECPHPGQVFQKCGIFRTCQNMYNIVTKPCTPGCYCDNNKVWDDETKSCLPMDECKDSIENRACRNIDINMQYYSSHPVERPTCRNPDPTPSGFNRSGCYCKPGYVWNKKHVCVALENCCVCEDLD